MPWTAADLPRLDGRTFLVTGASSGIGLVTANELARAGARVIRGVRDAGLDLADLGSVRAFADGVPEIDVLINNAGVMHPPLQRTADGFELQIGTNHLGHFALTNLLAPRIRERVVVVASNAHRYGRIDLDDLNWERRRYNRYLAYAQSKLANLLFASELQRRADVRVVSAHPGFAQTKLMRHSGVITKVGVRLLGQSAEMGALPTLFAATQDLPGDSYVGPDGPGGIRGYPALVDRTRTARDPELAGRLWELSEALTGVR